MRSEEENDEERKREECGGLCAGRAARSLATSGRPMGGESLSCLVQAMGGEATTGSHGSTWGR